MSDPNPAGPAEPSHDDGSGVAPPVPPAPTGQGWGTGYGQAPGYGPAPGYGQHGGPAAPTGPPSPTAGRPQYGQPQYGQPQYGQPQYGQPAYGQPAYGQPPSGYRPPPVQHGIVPLRPLGLGEIFDGAFRSVRANPRVMFGLSAVVVTISVLIETFVQWYALGSLGSLTSTSVSVDTDAVLGDLLGFGGGAVLSTIVTLVATTVLTGLLIISVSRSVIGQQISLGEAWARARPRIWRLLGLTLLVIALIFAVPAVWAAATIAAAANELWGLTAAVGLVGGLGVLVWVAWVSTRTLLSTPALMLEEQGVLAGFRRGWALSRGSFWRLLGIYLLATVIVGTVAGIIVTPAAVIPAALGLNPLGPLSLAINAVATIIASVLTTPFTAAVVALLYIDLRIRREGLDVELNRAAEAAAAQAVGGPRS